MRAFGQPSLKLQASSSTSSRCASVSPLGESPHRAAVAGLIFEAVLTTTKKKVFMECSMRGGAL